MEEYESPEIKQIDLNFDRFKVEKETEHEFEFWVNKTAKLINRPYYATFKLIEKWPVELIIRRYELSTKHAGNMPPDVKWWWLRKINNKKPYEKRTN